MTAETRTSDTEVLRRHRPGFRADIEGLRAVAILMVAVYHVWVGRVSGGVDIFLMISGFFVGASVVRSYSEGRALHLGRYYARVFGRLLPTLVVVLAATLVATWFLLPRTRMGEASSQALASLLYVENWYLALTGGEYAAADAEQSMSQHVWSLSVQGQLFVVLPLLLLVLSVLLRRWAWRRLYLVVVATLLVASFVYATVLGQVDQSTAYYSTLARAWQYLLGTLLAFVVVSAPARRIPSGARGALGALGLCAVLLTGLLVDGRALFPGPAALLPLVGAALVVLAGSAGGAEGQAHGRPAAVTRLLALRPLVRAGGSAYGFYLWHWPVLVLALALLPSGAVGWWEGLAVLAVSAVLTWFTELLLARRPGAVRRRDAPVPARVRRVILAVPRTVVVAVSLVTVVVGSTAWLLHLESQRRGVLSAHELDTSTYPGALAGTDPVGWPAPAGVDPVPTPEVSMADWPLRDHDGCAADTDEDTVHVCAFGAPVGDRRVAIVGGSHSASFLPALDTVGQVRGLTVESYIKRACPLRIEDADSSCERWSQDVIDRLVDEGYDAVVLTGTRPGGEDRDHVPASYLRAWRTLDDAGIPVVALRDNPWLPFHAAECVDQEGAAACSAPRADLLSATNPLDAEVSGFDALLPVDLSDAFCDEVACWAVVGNVQAYIDGDHLTATFARTLAVPLDDRLGAATGWW